jgi:hypothetical protein
VLEEAPYSAGMRRSSLAAGLAVLVLGLPACSAGDVTSQDVGDGTDRELHSSEPDEPEDAAGVEPEALDEPDGGGADDADDAEPGPTGGEELTAAARPDWLGTQELPRRADGFGQAQQTPDELVDRRLPPPEHLPPPSSDAFEADIARVPDEVLERSTWSSSCPVGRDELRYVTVTFWGFDDRAHTGELLVHHSAADDLVGVFESLYEVRFPIEEMRIVTAAELDAPPTGDGNNTTAFVCRPGVGGATWSEHAFGLAVDVNPFHNPYVRGDLVLPELSGAYLDRDDHRPGMIQPGDVVTESFATIGWGWGGTWRSSTDWMHFSASGR